MSTKIPSELISLLNTVDYAILHRWWSLPEYLFSDLDIVIAPQDFPRLEQALAEANDAHLVNFLHHESTGYYFILALQDESTIHFIPVDAATNYCRDGRVWFSAEELLEGRRKWKDFWVASPEVEFKYLLVKKFLKEHLPEYTTSRLQELAQELGQKADALAEELLGKHRANEVMTWIRTEQWASLEKNLPVLKKVLKQRKPLKDPLNPLRYYLPEVKRIWKRWSHPTGLWVVVLGPDGGGKSTLIGNLERELKGAFRRNAVFHLMPGLLRRQRNSGPITDPHGKPPRFLLASLLKLFYYLLDYNLGYWLKIRPALARSTLVLFDRYYDDLLIDPKRYRYGGPLGLVRWLQRLIPRPDLFLMLDVPVEQLLERKQEVKRKELDRQVEAYRIFALETPNGHLLDGSLPSEVVARHAREIVLDFLQKRYDARRPIWFSSQKRDRSLWLTRALGVEVSQGISTHAWLRLHDGRGYFLPLSNRHVFRRGLELYPAQKSKARFSKVALGVLAGLGLKGPGLSRVRLNEQENSIFQALRLIFGRDDLSFAVSLGMPGPHRKPVIQALSPQGEVLGYAKVGWNEGTRGLVANEIRINNLIRSLNLTRFRVPQILFYHEANDYNFVVTYPIEGDVGSWDEKCTQCLVEAMVEVAKATMQVELFGQSVFWKEVTERAARISDFIPQYQINVLMKALTSLEDHLNRIALPWVLRLGDTTTWNLSFDEQKGVLGVIDLEYGKEKWLVGWDIFKLFQDKEQPHALEMTMSGYLQSLGVNRQYLIALQLAFWIDIFTEWIEAWKTVDMQISPAARTVFERIIKKILILHNTLRVTK